MQQGYTFLADSNNLIFQVSFGATGVTSYKVGGQDCLEAKRKNLPEANDGVYK